MLMINSRFWFLRWIDAAYILSQWAQLKPLLEQATRLSAIHVW